MPKPCRYRRGELFGIPPIGDVKLPTGVLTS
jgi:hypothetical protein